jgi:uncharacterized membrane protein YeaQ/YmgE (transglycosylase-associated protein family)
MDVLFALLVWALFGLIIGAIARLLIPGRQPIGILRTILLGVVGSLLGGFIAWLFVGGHPLQPSGWILSIIGAVLVLWIYVASKRRRYTA